MYKLLAITLALAVTVAIAANTRDFRGQYQHQPEFQFQQRQERQFQHQPTQFQFTDRQDRHYQQQRQSHHNVPSALHQTSTYSKLTRDDTSEAHNPFVPVPFLQSFREYTMDLLRQPYYMNAYENTGAVSYCSFTLGHLLAVINERVFNVPTHGIPKVLKLKSGDVAEAYSGIMDTFMEDCKVTPSSYFYTPDASLPVPPQYTNLHTTKEVMKLYQNPQASSFINENYKTHTFGVIDNLVVPKFPPFNDTVVGVHSNSFYYIGHWVYPFTPIGEKPFYVTPDNMVHVQTLQSAANYPVSVTEGYSAVAIPLVGDSEMKERKHIVLVQPKTTMQDFMQHYVSEIFLTAPQKWQKQHVKIQVPALNMTLGRNFVSQLNDLAGTTTQCFDTSRDDAVPVHYLHPIVQVISSSFNAEGYELAVANGVQVDKYFGTPAKTVKSGQQHHQLPLHKQDKTFLEPLKVKTVREIDQTIKTTPVVSQTEFYFNKPYFVYVHDYKLGAVSFTAVKTPFVDHVHHQHNHDSNKVGYQQKTHIVKNTANTVRQQRHAVNHLDFDETSKVYRWNCGHDEATVDHVHEHGYNDHQSLRTRTSCATQY